MSPEEALDALTDLVAPTDPPGSMPRWDGFEARNGFAPPTDWRLMIDRYGSGGFGADEVTGPWLLLLTGNATTSVVDQSEETRRVMRGHQRQFPAFYPGWPMWPEPGGMLPWGETIDGDTVGWRTTGSPDEWGTYWFGRHDDYIELDVGAVEFIVLMFRGEIALLAEVADAYHPLRYFAHANPVSSARVDFEQAQVTFHGFVEPFLLKRETRQLGDDAAELGLKVRRVGWDGRREDSLRQPRCTIGFTSATEHAAKDLIRSFAERLGVEIASVHNLEYESIWTDLGDPPG